MKRTLETDGSFFARLKQMEREAFKDDPEMLALMDEEERLAEEEIKKEEEEMGY